MPKKSTKSAKPSSTKKPTRKTSASKQRSGSRADNKKTVKQSAETAVSEQVVLAEEQGPVEAASMQYLYDAASLDKLRRRRRRKIVAVGLLAALLVSGGVLFAKLMHTETKRHATPAQNRPDDASVDESVTTKMLQATVTLAEGRVQVSNDNNAWSDLAQSITLAQGSYVRTAEAGRAALTFPDGSVVRLNNNALIRLTTTNNGVVAVDNLRGEVYARVADSSRKFTVTIGNVSYATQSAAYKTIAQDQVVNGVMSYYNSTDAGAAKVGEGQQFFTAHGSQELANKVLPITKEQLRQDAFMRWNYEQDKLLAQFKDKLGYLVNFEQGAVQAAVTPVPPRPATPTTSSGSITLAAGVSSDTVALAWKIAGAPRGSSIRLMKGLRPNPVYGADESVAINDITQRSYSWLINGGKAYHFRACIFVQGRCAAYSSNIVANVPVPQPAPASAPAAPVSTPAPVVVTPVPDPVSAPEPPPAQPTNSLKLMHQTGTHFTWIADGLAPFGYQLLWSTVPGPIYPGPTPSRSFGPDATEGAIAETIPGTYYVRLCTYAPNDTCTNYSNEVQVVLE